MQFWTQKIVKDALWRWAEDISSTRVRSLVKKTSFHHNVYAENSFLYQRNEFFWYIIVSIEYTHSRPTSILAAMTDRNVVCLLILPAHFKHHLHWKHRF